MHIVNTFLTFGHESKKILFFNRLYFQMGKNKRELYYSFFSSLKKQKTRHQRKKFLNHQNGHQWKLARRETIASVFFFLDFHELPTKASSHCFFISCPTPPSLEKLKKSMLIFTFNLKQYWY